MVIRLVAVPEPDGIQALPSADVITLVPPTATNMPLPKATADNGGVAAELRSSQVTASAEVRILPAFCAVTVLVYDPTATNCPAPCAIPDKVAVGMGAGLLQVTPSVDLA